MRPVRLLFVTACAAAVASALPARAAVPERVTLLTATTVVSTVTSTTAEVFLPADATLSSRYVGNRDVQLAGRGRVVGVWLEPLDGGTDFLTSYRLPAFAGGRQLTYGSTRSGGLELHRGRYRLTVLADGAPLQVVLSLRGLDAGRTEVRGRAVRSAQRPLPVRDAAGSSLVTFGAAVDLGRPVQTMTVATAVPVEEGLIETASTCERPDAGDQPLAFGPPCIGGTGGGFVYEAGPDAQRTSGASAFASSSYPAHTGVVGLGGAFSSTSGVRVGQALGVWLERVES